MPHQYGSHGQKIGGRRKTKEKEKRRRQGRVWARTTDLGEKEARRHYDERDLGGVSKKAAKRRQALGPESKGTRRVRFTTPSPPRAATLRRKRSASRETSAKRGKSPKKARSQSPPRSRVRRTPRATPEDVDRMIREARAAPGYERRRAGTPVETEQGRAARHAKPPYPERAQLEPPAPKKRPFFDVHKPRSLLEKGARALGKATGLLSPTPDPERLGKREKPEPAGLTVRRRDLMADAEERAKRMVKQKKHAVAAQPGWEERHRNVVEKIRLGGRKPPPEREGLQLDPAQVKSKAEQTRAILRGTRLGVADISQQDVPAELQTKPFKDLPPHIQEQAQLKQYTEVARKRGAKPYQGKYGPQIEARDRGLAQAGDAFAATRVASAEEADEAAAKQQPQRRTFSAEERAAVKRQYQTVSESPEPTGPTLKLTGTRPTERPRDPWGPPGSLEQAGRGGRQRGLSAFTHLKRPQARAGMSGAEVGQARTASQKYVEPTGPPQPRRVSPVPGSTVDWHC